MCDNRGKDLEVSSEVRADDDADPNRTLATFFLRALVSARRAGVLSMVIRAQLFAAAWMLVIGLVLVVQPVCGEEAAFKAGDQVVTTERVEVKATQGTVATLDAGVQVTVADVKQGWVGITVEQEGKKITGWVAPKSLARSGGEVAKAATAPSGEASTASAAAAFEQGYAAHRKGNFSAAIADYSEAIRLDPNHARAYSNRGMAYQAKRDLNRAIADFSTAIRLAPTLSAAYLNRGIAILAKGDVDKAIDDFTEAIRLDSKSVLAYRMRAAAHEKMGHMAMAAEDIALAAKAYQPKYMTIAHRAIKFELEVKNEQYAPNYELLDAIIDEAKARIKTKKSYTEAEAKDVLKTIDDILLQRRFINVQPMLVCDAIIPHKMPPQMVNALDARVVRFRPKAGEIVFFTHSYATSFLYASIGEALELPIRVVLAPGHTFVRWYLTKSTYVNWETTMGAAKTDEEYKAWRQISDTAIKNGLYLAPLSQSGLLSCVFANIGLVWRGDWFGLDNEYSVRSDRSKEDEKSGKNPKNAAAKADKTPKTDNTPKSDNTPKTDKTAKTDKGDKEDKDDKKNENRGKVDKNEAVRYTRAVINFSKALDLNKKLYEIWIQRAMCWTRAGQFDKAVADIAFAMQLDPDQPAGFFHRGITYQAAGSDKKAIEDFTKVIELTPKAPNGYYFRGVVRTHSNELDKAMDDLNKAIELQPRYADAYFARSKVWEKLGNRGKAEYDLRKIRELQLQR
jgi:tetratricopeptide (TPR) repeat protein